MSTDYACAYYDNEICRLFSDEKSTSYCVLGPCGHERLTNAGRIRAMSDGELADFLASVAYASETPWCQPFADQFCKDCPTAKVNVEGHSNPLELTECDFADGECPHGSDIVWWLRQPAEEDRP